MIMSTHTKTPQSATDRPARTKFKVDHSDNAKRPIVEKIDIAALELDETFGLDCDPYNSTGQFLADAVKQKYEEE